MFKKQEARTQRQVNHIGFAFLVGIGAAASVSIKTGNLGFGIASGIAVFLIFGLEFN